MKLVPFSCGWAMAPGHLQLHRLPFEFNHHSWLLAGQLWYSAFMGKQMANLACIQVVLETPFHKSNLIAWVRAPSTHTLAICRDSSPKHVPSVLLQFKQHFLSKDGKALYLPFIAHMNLSKLKVQLDKTWFSIEASPTLSRGLDQVASKSLFQPELLRGSVTLASWEGQE